MKPVSPVILGSKFPEAIIAEHQDEYGNLPAISLDGGDKIVTRWHMMWMWTFRRPVTPVLIEVDVPQLEVQQ